MRYLLLILGAILCAPMVWAQDAPNAPDRVLTATLNSEGGSFLDVDKGATGLLQQLLKLRTTASMLHTTAHPDDEHAGLLTYLSRGMGARTALLALNRGEAGANAIGPELFDALGLIRTEELRLSDRYYGLDDQYYSGALDYGYSKTLEESMRSWDRDLVLAEMVRVIRMNRPLVVISRFHASLRDGHGNHQAVGQLTPEAVKAAADPAQFPEQIIEEGLRPWSVPKLYRGGVRENELWHVKLDASVYSPWLGRTYQNFGAYGLSLQRSQTSGRTRTRMGPVPYYYELLGTESDTQESSFFDGLDTSLSGVFALVGEEVPDGATAVLQYVETHIERALEHVNMLRPHEVAPGLAAGLTGVRNVLAMIPAAGEVAFMLRIKEQQLMHALTTSIGMACEATAVPSSAGDGGAAWWSPQPVMGPVVRGQDFRVDVACTHAPEASPQGLAATLEDPTGRSIDAWGLTAHKPDGEAAYFKVSFDLKVPDDAEYSMPYYFRDSVRENHYQYRDLTWRHLPSRPAALVTRIAWEVDGTDVTLHVPVQTREANLPNGYVMRKLQVVPALAVSATPRHRVVVAGTGASTFHVAVDVLGNSDTVLDGTLRLVLPEGWTSAPEAHEFSFDQAGQRAAFNFEVTVAGLGTEARTIGAVATAMGAEFTEGYQIVRHSHMETRYLYRSATIEVRGLDVAIAPDLQVGYVMGVGDEVPSGIEQLGAEVTLLSSADLAGKDLSTLDVIVVGTRAYAVRQDLHTYNRRLLDFAQNGGNLIVLYQTQEFVPGDMAPFDALLPRGAEEVSEEDAGVTILVPESPIFQYPNSITAADFDGWVEQRGSKFFTEWDAAYTPLIQMNDTGQDPQEGAFLTATHGKGHYTYAALAFHRQLPYSVTGAYRLFANLLSLGHAP